MPEKYRIEGDALIFNEGITEIAFEDLRHYDEAEETYLLDDDVENITEIIIPNSVTFIGEGAFDRCESLKSIVIPNSVTEIGLYGSFSGCKSLESINLPDSIEEIEEGAFYGCESLKSIVIPDSVTSIGKSAFEKCKSLKSIVTPNSVVSIEDYAFHNCPNLTIKCNKGSYAEQYAKENNIPCEHIGIDRKKLEPKSMFDRVNSFIEKKNNLKEQIETVDCEINALRAKEMEIVDDKFRNEFIGYLQGLYPSMAVLAQEISEDAILLSLDKEGCVSVTTLKKPVKISDKTVSSNDRILVFEYADRKIALDSGDIYGEAFYDLDRMKDIANNLNSIKDHIELAIDEFLDSYLDEAEKSLNTKKNETRKLKKKVGIER